MAISTSTPAPAPTPTPAPAPAPAATPTEPTPLETAVKGMDSSVSTITKLVAATKTEDTQELVRANVLHLEYALGTDLIKNSKTDTKAYTDAIAKGKAFLA